MQIATILPVSRTRYLDKIIDSLLSQTVKINNLIVIHDGSDREFLEVRNKILQLKFDNVICVPSTNVDRADSIPDRRRHIVNIHNQFREIIGNVDWVFSIEDDGIIPPDALQRLISVVEAEDNVGMVTGVELGRWGVPYVGAWKVNDVFTTTSITSMPNKTLTNKDEYEEIDGCGLYCALIRADKYKEHTFSTSNGIGPDVNLGLYLRQQGLKNYVVWGIPVTHMTSKYGEEIEIPATSQSREITLNFVGGSTWQH